MVDYKYLCFINSFPGGLRLALFSRYKRILDARFSSPSGICLEEKDPQPRTGGSVQARLLDSLLLI